MSDLALVIFGVVCVLAILMLFVVRMVIDYKLEINNRMRIDALEERKRRS
jgi:septation ring formation regulator EzrA